MGLYARYVLPRLVHAACGLPPNRKQREKVVPRASGRVLELGAGSGLNLPYYDACRVEHLVALEPAPEMWAMAEPEARRAGFPVEALSAGAEAIPLETGSVDTVVATYVLCTVPDVGAALAETRRVLRGGGELLFVEHGLSPDPGVRKWQSRINPLWKRVAGGCHLDRDVPALLAGAGFDLESLDTMYLPGPRFATYNYWGVARSGSLSRPEADRPAS